MMTSGSDLFKEGTGYTTVLSPPSAAATDRIFSRIKVIDRGMLSCLRLHTKHLLLYLRLVTLRSNSMQSKLRLLCRRIFVFFLRCLGHYFALTQPVIGAVRGEYFAVTFNKLDLSGYSGMWCCPIFPSFSFHKGCPRIGNSRSTSRHLLLQGFLNPYLDYLCSRFH